MTAIRKFRQAEHSRGRGRAAEDDAVEWLREQGFELVARNVAFRAGELDVIALEGETLCFIEIKARASARHGGALWAVDRRKQRQIGTAAKLYLAARPYPGPCRFDVLAMDAENGEWSFNLVRDAFELE